MRNLFYLLFAATLVACGSGSGTKTEQSATPATEVATETIIEVAVDSLIANGAIYEGKTVKFSGVVHHVCKHSGAKLTISGTAPDTYLKVMATADVESFDPEFNEAKVEVVGVVSAFETKKLDDCSTAANAKSDADGRIFVVNCKSITKL